MKIEAANKNPKIPEAQSEARQYQVFRQPPTYTEQNVVIPHSLSPNIGPATGTRQWLGGKETFYSFILPAMAFLRACGSLLNLSLSSSRETFVDDGLLLDLWLLLTRE